MSVLNGHVTYYCMSDVNTYDGSKTTLHCPFTILFQLGSRNERNKYHKEIKSYSLIFIKVRNNTNY